MANTALNTPLHDELWYRERIEYLSGFALPERIETLRSVLNSRTRYMTVLMENTFHPQNASALVRTCEAFGIQDIYTIETLCQFNPNVNIVKGSDKWIDIHRQNSTAKALRSLRAAGYRIVATTPHDGDHTPTDFDVTQGPFAVVFGTEHAGISEEVINEADDFIKIPMYGFVESLNVSASAAILLHILSERLRASDIRWELSEDEHSELMLKWLTKSVSDSENILSRRFPK